MNTPARTLTANSIASVLGTGLSALFSVVYISLGARWLGPVEYGNVGALVALSNVLQLVLSPLEQGLTLSTAGLAGQGRLSALHTFVLRVQRALLVLSLPLLALWSLATLLVTWLGSSYPPAALHWLGVFCVGGLVICLPRAVLRAREQFVPLALNIGIESALRLAIGLALLWLSENAAAMIAGYALSTWAATLLALRVMRRGLPTADAAPARGIDFALLSQPFRAVTGPLLGVHLYAALLVNLDVLAAKHYLAPREAGLYAGAAAISRIVAVGATPILLVLFSRLANLSAAQASTRRTFRLGALAIVGGLLLSLLVPALFGQYLLRGSLGSAFQDAQQVLLIQWASACVLVLQVFVGDSVLATSRMRAAWLLALPVLGLALGFVLWHDSATAIASVSLGVCLTLGTLVYYLLWRLRQPAAPVSP